MHQVGMRAGTGRTTTSPTPGGGGRKASRGRGPMVLTDAHYLWLLVALEVLAHVGLRHWSRSHHGG